MGRRHPNHRLVKTHRNYTVEEAAHLLTIHKNTVRNWIGRGLATIDAKRPTLILGTELARFLTERRQKAKQTCPPGHMFCLRCRAPKEPAGDMADYLPMTDTGGNLRGICPTCEGLIHRRVSLANLERIKGRMAITFPQAQLHIGDSRLPSLNCDFGTGA